jgi:hypothetical protein
MNFKEHITDETKATDAVLLQGITENFQSILQDVLHAVKGTYKCYV